MMELVPYQRWYLKQFIEWRNQPLSVRHNPLREMNRQQISRMLESEGSDLTDLRKFSSYRWFVLCDTELVGTVALKNISHSMGYGEIGYGIAEAHHGRGIGTAAVSLLIAKIFQETPLRKLIALVHVENHASRRLLAKLGFRQEGLLVEHYVIQNHPVDEVLYGLLKREWNSSCGQRATMSI